MRIAFENCGKRFFTLRGFVEAVRDISIEIGEGEFFILLGPSGSGKSTLLNLTAGLERLTRGEIRFGDKIVDSPGKGIFHPPRKRNVAMVFQTYALYPHLNVFKNIAFPLEIAGEKKVDIRKAVEEVSRLLEIEELMGRKPAELSGGQRQRVAIARALVRRPGVFLLDEPLSNLDVQLRANTRTELKRLQQELGITTVYVTHDQTEAMTLGDRIALIKNGTLVQVGSPQEIYEKPKTPFAATFIGFPPMNLLPAEVMEEEGKVFLTCGRVHVTLPEEKKDWIKRLRMRKVLLGIRTEHISLSEAVVDEIIPGIVTAVEPLGREDLLHISTECCNLLILSGEKRIRKDQKVGLSFDPGQISLFDPEQKDD